MRWWTSWRTAEPVVKSVTREKGVDGVGTAVLGLHALGADALRGLASRTCVDSDLVAETLAGLDVGPVAKAWSDAVMPGSDYGWLRVGPIKRDADDAAVRVVSTLVSKGVSWPLALQRAAEGYGLPAGDAVAFAQKVSAPVVNQLVVADAADEQLALFASSVCKAESDAPVEFSKADDEWVVIRRGNRAFRQRVSRDAEGQFASSEGAQAQQPVSEQEALAARREAFVQGRKKKMAQNRSLQRQVLSRSTQRAVQERQAAEQEKQRQSLSEVAREQFDRKAALEALRDQRPAVSSSQQRARLQAVLRARFKSHGLANVKTKDVGDWRRAGVDNWPVRDDDRTWHVDDQARQHAMLVRPETDTSGNAVKTLTDASMVPVLSVTPDGLAVLVAAAKDRDSKNHYIDMISLVEADLLYRRQNPRKKLFETRWLPTDAPQLELPVSADEQPMVNFRLSMFAENPVDPETGMHDSSFQEATSQVSSWSAVSQTGASLGSVAVNYDPYVLQRVKLAPSKLEMLGGDMLGWFDPHYDNSQAEMNDAMNRIMRSSAAKQQKMAAVYAHAISPLHAGSHGEVELDAESEVLQELLAIGAIEPVSNAGQSGGQRYTASFGSAAGEILQRMAMTLEKRNDSLPVEFTPEDRVVELSHEIGMDPDEVLSRMPKRLPPRPR